MVREQAQWAWLELWTVVTWKKQRHLKDEQYTLVQEPPLCFSSQNDHGISMNILRQGQWTLTIELITTCQAGFHWVPMEASTQLYQEPSKGAAQLLWKRKKSIHYLYLHFLFVSLFHLVSRGRRTWSPSHSSWSPPRNHPEQTCRKTSLATCDGKGHFWMSDCSRRLLFISHEETIIGLQGKPRLPVWKTRDLEKPRDLSTEVRHTPMGKVLSSWYRESFWACKHLITLHLLWSPLLKSCFNSPTAAS